MCLLGIVPALLLPETKGKTPHEIQVLLSKSQAWASCGDGPAAEGLTQPISAHQLLDETGLLRKRNSSALVLSQ